MKSRALSEQTVNEKKERDCLLPQSLYRDKCTIATHLQSERIAREEQKT